SGRRSGWLRLGRRGVGADHEAQFIRAPLSRSLDAEGGQRDEREGDDRGGSPHGGDGGPPLPSEAGGDRAPMDGLPKDAQDQFLVRPVAPEAGMLEKRGVDEALARGLGSERGRRE